MFFCPWVDHSCRCYTTTGLKHCLEGGHFVVAAIDFSSDSSSFGRVPHFQMPAVMVFNQHRVSTSKTVSPRIPVGARCTGHVRMMCSAVCSAAPHSQFDVGARPHLCMND